MKWKSIVLVLLAALAIVLLLFDVDLNPVFSLAGETRELDPEQEAHYAACYAARDRDIHAQAFGTIDNPDVQKLYIKTHRAEAAADCRQQYPERWHTVATPLRINLIDLRFRYR